MNTTFCFISGGEILIILFIIVLLFGADKLPGIAQSFGKMYRDFQKATYDIKQEFDANMNEPPAPKQKKKPAEKEIESAKDSEEEGEKS